MGADPGSEPVQVAIRYADVDALQHVYHATYLTLFDEARTEWLRRCGVERPDQHVVARIEIDYLRPITLADRTIEVEHRAHRVGRTSLVVAASMTVEVNPVATMLATLVMWDAQGAHPRPFTEDERARLSILDDPS